MSILIATQSYKHAVNGQATFAVHLAEGLAAAGHQVHILTPSFRGRAYQVLENRVHIHNITAIPLRPFVNDVAVTPLPGPQVKALLDEIHPQIVHILDHYPLCRSVARAAFRRSLPTLGTNHFLPENMAPYIPLLSRFEAGRRLLDRVLWWSVLSLYSRLDEVTSPTQIAIDILQQQGLNVPMEAISCGVELERFNPDPKMDRRQTRLRFGLDPDRILFLYVGRVDREKRLDVLLRAVHQLDRGDIQAAIAGQGNYLRRLRQLAQELKLDQKLVFLGFIPDPELPALLNSVDFFAMPSTAELQSIATLQAMSTGLPVWAADSRALPELVSDGRNGCLFRPDDISDAARQMSRLADSMKRWHDMSTASLEIARKHELMQTLKRYEALYQKLNPSVAGLLQEGEIETKIHDSLESIY